MRETSTTSTPREVCEDVVVQERAPERDGNVGGTVAGAVIGGLVGNQVGGGNGRKAATAAGAVAGGFIGNHGRQAPRRRQGHQPHRAPVPHRQSTSQSSRVVAYNVTYRNPDGTTGTHAHRQQAGQPHPAGRATTRSIGYDVTYRYDGQEQTDPHGRASGRNRLPVIDGQVVTQTAAAASGDHPGLIRPTIQRND